MRLPMKQKQQTVGFVVKEGLLPSNELLLELLAWLKTNNITALIEDHITLKHSYLTPVNQQDLTTNTSLGIALGGDGTMLRATHLFSNHHIPILGVNLGRLGFLNPFAPDEALEALKQAIHGTLPIDERMRITTHHHSGNTITTDTVLNEVIFKQNNTARLIDFKTKIDGVPLTQYRADGLIIATPTGSTAYSMAAGGPILVPGHQAMTLTPICAHSLTHRPLVVRNDSVIQISFDEPDQQIAVTLDGQRNVILKTGDWIEVSLAKIPCRIFRSSKSYFDILRKKLHWGASPQ